MKVKTSITLSEKLLETLNELFKDQANRSQLIENIIWEYIKSYNQKNRDISDLSILNKNAEHLNKEARDVLSYQADL